MAAQGNDSEVSKVPGPSSLEPPRLKCSGVQCPNSAGVGHLAFLESFENPSLRVPGFGEFFHCNVLLSVSPGWTSFLGGLALGSPSIMLKLLLLFLQGIRDLLMLPYAVLLKVWWVRSFSHVPPPLFFFHSVQSSSIQRHFTVGHKSFRVNVAVD